ncbi:PLP-dependent aminotransferase family protein [Paenibacillus sp. FA6]|uniref:aminotransferase-like domain-containing protein n=1 Tax=Paenibacillus sp. FA6 TaxID=3413029 RepID=UPI003F6598DC
MKYSFASHVEWIMSSPSDNISSNPQQGSFISLADEWPTSDIFPLTSMHTAATDVLLSLPQALQYGNIEGYMPLREWLQLEWKQHKQLDLDINQILITRGSEHAMDLLVRVYVDKGDAVLVENPTSPSSLQILRMQGATIIPVEGDQEGLLAQQLVELIEKHHPKLLFVTPNFTNPTGVLWSLERRKQVLELCRAYQVFIVEDDSYGDLYFEESKENEPFSRRYPSLSALDDHGKGGQVLYVGSFSKTVAPGLSTGFAAGPSKLIEVMGAAKQWVDRQSCNLNQRLLYQMLTSTTFDWHEHITLLRREYSTRLRLMTELLKRPAWRKAKYNLPSGGMFLWVQLPEGLRSELLLKCSISKGTSFCVGTECYADKNMGFDVIRLNFTHPRRDELLLGMHLLSEAVNEFTARS